MTRSRFVLALAVAALTALPSFAAVDPAIVRLFPADAQMIFGIDIDQSRNSPFGRYLLAEMQVDGPEFKSFIDETGLDPRRDLIDAYLATIGNEGGKTRNLIVVRGNFDTSRLTGVLRARGAKSELFSGTEIYAMPHKHSGDSVAFLGGNMALMGDTPSIKDAIARSKTSQTAVSKATLALIDDLDARYDVWMHSLVPAQSLLNKLPDQRANSAMRGDMFRAIQQASGGVKFGANIQFAGTATAKTDKDALALQDVLRFLSSMVHLNREKQGAEEIASLLDNLHVETKANILTMSLSVPQAAVEKMIESQKGRGKKAPRRATAVI